MSDTSGHVAFKMVVFAILLKTLEGFLSKNAYPLHRCVKYKKNCGCVVSNVKLPCE